MTNIKDAFSVKIFMPDGDPDGLKIIERLNWNGSGILTPRSLFREYKKRDEFGRAGVYILVGPDEISQLPRVYIGQGDPILPRLEDHSRKKDFWTHLLGFTSKDENLNSAHVKHLESRLCSLAKAAKRCVLENGNSPKLPSLSEADIAYMESFLIDVLLCLSVLGYGYFEPEIIQEESRMEYQIKSRGITARGYESSKGIVVLKGSQVMKEETASMHAYLHNLRSSLLEQGVISEAGNTYEMSQDYSFNSPSTAAGVILGRSANGRVEWKLEDGRTLKSVQDDEVGD